MKYTLIIIPFALVVNACGDTSHADKAAQFQTALSNGDKSTAREIGRQLSVEISEGNDSLLWVRQLCELALGYMTMSDKSDMSLQDDDIAMAKVFYNKAMSVSADSVAAFGREVDTEDAGAWMLLEQIDVMEGTQVYLEDFAEQDTINWTTDSLQ